MKDRCDHCHGFDHCGLPCPLVVEKHRDELRRAQELHEAQLRQLGSVIPATDPPPPRPAPSLSLRLLGDRWELLFGEHQADGGYWAPRVAHGRFKPEGLLKELLADRSFWTVFSLAGPHDPGFIEACRVEILMLGGQR